MIRTRCRRAPGPQAARRVPRHRPARHGRRRLGAPRRSPGDAGLQLLENAAATAAALVAIILAVGPVSGAHLNPAVTLADRFFGGICTKAAVGYLAAQLIGGYA